MRPITAGWSPHGPVASPRPTSGGCMSDTFHVMFQAVPPRPSWMAWRHKSFGTLNITADHARFVPRKGEPVLIEHVLRVSRGWKQSSRGAWIPPAMDTYIEVLHGDRSEPR